MNFRPRIYECETVDRHRTPQQWTIVETVNAAMALMLIASPWTFRYADASAAAWSAVLIGLLLGAITLARTIEARDWQGWASLALGTCALLAPWLLGFGEIKNAAGMHVTVGLAVVTMTLITLWVHYLDQSPTPA